MNKKPFKLSNIRAALDPSEPINDETEAVVNCFAAMVVIANELEGMEAPSPTNEADPLYWEKRKSLQRLFEDLFLLDFLTLSRDSLVKLICWVSKWSLIGQGAFLLRIRFMAEGGSPEGTTAPKYGGPSFTEDFDQLAGEMFSRYLSMVPYLIRINNDESLPVRSLVFKEPGIPGDVLTKLVRWANVRGLRSALEFNQTTGNPTWKVLSPDAPEDIVEPFKSFK